MVYLGDVPPDTWDHMVATINNSLGTMKFDDVVAVSLREELRKKSSINPSTNEFINSYL